MEKYEKILYLMSVCDKQGVCNKCPLRNIDGENGCAGCIDEWEEEKVNRAYEIILKEGKIFKEILWDRRVVELRNGNRYLVVGDFLMGENDFFIKDDFTNDLVNHGLRKFDIVRVYESIPRIGDLYNKNLNIIWKREAKKMTRKEIEEALGYEIEIVWSKE